MKILCIVSNREKQLREFFRAWRSPGDWDAVVLVESGADHELRDLDSPWPLYHFAGDEIERELGAASWIISRGDTALVSFAFLKAAQLGAEWILKLDDDCLPIDGAAPICAAHLAAMARPRCVSTCDLRVRGLPYRNAGQMRSLLNCGLWQGVPDLGAPEGLVAQERPYLPPPGNWLAHPRQRLPLCGMNLFFHRSLLPALYFGLQGRGQPYARFDDIWCGWIFQRAAEHCRVPWSFGAPHIYHSRASDPFANLQREAPGIALNESLWERIDRIALTASELPGAVREIALDLVRDDEPYLSRLGHALDLWVEEVDGRR